SVGYLRVDPLLRALQRAPLARVPHGDDLGQDREGRLRLRLGADVEAAGPVDPLEVGLVDAGLEQALAAALLVSPGAERADVEGLRLERRLQHRYVELVVVREDDDRRRMVGLDLLQRLLGP